MKKINILYWIFTGLFSAFMILTSIPDIMKNPEAIDFMTKQLGYPAYFTPFIGMAKILGSIAILIPGFPRVKEWAYAGLFYDLIGAVYSVYSIGSPISGLAFFIIPITIGALSYIYHHKKFNAVTE